MDMVQDSWKFKIWKTTDSSKSIVFTIQWLGYPILTARMDSWRRAGGLHILNHRSCDSTPAAPHCSPPWCSANVHWPIPQNYSEYLSQKLVTPGTQKKTSIEELFILGWQSMMENICTTMEIHMAYAGIECDVSATSTPDPSMTWTEFIQWNRCQKPSQNGHRFWEGLV